MTEREPPRRKCSGCGRRGCDGTKPGAKRWQRICLGGMARRRDDEQWATKRARWGPPPEPETEPEQTEQDHDEHEETEE